MRSIWLQLARLCVFVYCLSVVLRRKADYSSPSGFLWLDSWFLFVTVPSPRSNRPDSMFLSKLGLVWFLVRWESYGEPSLLRCESFLHITPAMPRKSPKIKIPVAGYLIMESAVFSSSNCSRLCRWSSCNFSSEINVSMLVWFISSPSSEIAYDGDFWWCSRLLNVWLFKVIEQLWK